MKPADRLCSQPSSVANQFAMYNVSWRSSTWDPVISIKPSANCFLCDSKKTVNQNCCPDSGRVRSGLVTILSDSEECDRSSSVHQTSWQCLKEVWMSEQTLRRHSRSLLRYFSLKQALWRSPFWLLEPEVIMFGRQIWCGNDADWTRWHAVVPTCESQGSQALQYTLL